MLTIKKATPLLSILLCLGLLSLIYWSSQKGHASKVKDFIPPPPHIEHSTFGLRYQMADGLWLRAIQDFDYCEVKLAEHLCKDNSWLSEMLLTVVRLDDQFRMVYLTGGLALTVIISDYAGASKLFDKGVEKFPRDWQMLYNAAYHALYEEKDNVKAAGLYKRAAENGAPSWVYSLAHQLYTKAGEHTMGNQLIELMQQIGVEEHVINRMKERIQRAHNETKPNK